MALLGAGIVPHAPLLVHGLAPDSSRAARRVLERAASSGAPIVLVSPHGERPLVYAEARGSLDGFGMKGHAVEQPGDRSLADRLAATLSDGDAGASEEEADHGVVVPLLLAEGALNGANVIAASLPECTGPGSSSVAEALAAADRLRSGLEALAASRDLFLLASAHTSAALSARAPQQERPEGLALDRAVLAALDEDPERLAHLDPAAWDQAGACGAGPLALFGGVSGGRAVEVESYDAPYGVGYLCASWSAPGGAP